MHVTYLDTSNSLITGWWFGTFGLFFRILGISSSQLTNSMIFQRGRVETTNQMPLKFPLNAIKPPLIPIKPPLNAIKPP